ncbi:helix-turn-helix domain-containing protein [Collinsella aerofaciens]|uniref:helix-turn-helix domain-containing protein n=1 Tax=Collinsella aerofaciens TaxID=74426 RepID=UPI0018996A6E|nr:helix-turn-helix transcriptional regulator [Collinsella aerofaciens]MDB1829798.1 helix-turn-helix transcriptional regulator [Collinsella aerofaciens]
MLNENIRAIRKSRGLSQEELAIKLNVVRRTVSKWERGLSVPDSDMLVSLSDTLDVPVATLLGEAVSEPEADALRAIAERLEVVNLQLARKQQLKRKVLCGVSVAVCAAIALAFTCVAALGSPYLQWDFDDPELAVAGTLYHGFEWVFVRVAPVLFLAAIVAALFVRKKMR